MVAKLKEAVSFSQEYMLILFGDIWLMPNIHVLFSREENMKINSRGRNREKLCTKQE